MGSRQPKTVVVTGANRGIGLALAAQLASQGCRVIATSRQLSNTDQLKQLSGDVRITELDVASTPSVEAWAEELAASGVQHLDLLINNAGVGGSTEGLMDITADSMLTRYVTNTLGPVLVTQHLKKRGLLGRGSLVVMISSIMGSIADDTFSFLPALPYRCSKAALNMLAKHVDIELAKDGGKCISMHPGRVQTDQTGGRGQLTPAESAAAMMEVLQREGGLQGGGFYSYTGELLPW